MKRIDAFPYNGEADMLECRLTELDEVADAFVIVEADVTHGGNDPKPYRFLEHQERFAPWADRIVYVQATDLPDLADPWSRELGQREWIWEGLRRLDAQPDDLVFQSDVDEIPSALAFAAVRPRGMVVLYQRLHTFAVDWVHPRGYWEGTVVARTKDIGRMGDMRNARLFAPTVLRDPTDGPMYGWHLSWVSDGIAAKEAKIRAFCHSEIRPTWEHRLGECYEAGRHVDGAMLVPVEVEEGLWPRWITDGNAPAAWFRPRERAEAEPLDAPPILAPFIIDGEGVLTAEGLQEFRSDV